MNSMTFPKQNGYQAYQKNKYETASPHRLILMLYEGAIRFANQACRALDNHNIAESNTALKKAQDIVYELMACLNFEQGGAIATNLNQLYLYIVDLFIKANTEKNKSNIEEAITILTEIKSSWEQIGREVSVSHG